MTSGKFGNYFQLAYSFSYDYITAIDDQYLRKVFIDACVADPDRITDLVKQRFDLVD